MRLEDSLFALDEVVGVILQHGSTLCLLLACCHNLHQAHHRCHFPVTLCAKAVAFFLEALDCKSRKLL